MNNEQMTVEQQVWSSGFDSVAATKMPPNFSASECADTKLESFRERFPKPKRDFNPQRNEQGEVVGINVPKRDGEDGPLNAVDSPKSEKLERAKPPPDVWECENCKTWNRHSSKTCVLCDRYLQAQPAHPVGMSSTLDPDYHRIKLIQHLHYIGCVNPRPREIDNTVNLCRPLVGMSDRERELVQSVKEWLCSKLSSSSLGKVVLKQRIADAILAYCDVKPEQQETK